ncbi:hypothetical protein G6F31_021211 [Rhizopus arrhizus]|nr:hypothetical protein G6F31_021211 [Rhizopus arrhizus]
MRGQVRQQGQPQIGGRGAVRGRGRRPVLHVVRDQPVVFGPAVPIEERPGLARQQAQELVLAGRQRGFRDDGRPAQAPGNCRHQGPHGQHRERRGPGRRVPAQDAGADRQRQQRRPPYR